MFPYIDVFRVSVVRSTRWTCAAALLPSRSCWSTGIQPPRCQWSSLCHLLRSYARLHPALLLACRGFLSHCVVTPPPPPPTGARTLSAQTTRWRCQSTMKCWLHHAPLLMHRQVKIWTSSCFWLFRIDALFSGAPPAYLEMLESGIFFFKDSGTLTEWWTFTQFEVLGALDQVLVYFDQFRVSSNVTSLPVWAAENHPSPPAPKLLQFQNDETFSFFSLPHICSLIPSCLWGLEAVALLSASGLYSARWVRLVMHGKVKHLEDARWPLVLFRWHSLQNMKVRPQPC